MSQEKKKSIEGEFPDPDLSIFDDPNYAESFKKEVQEYKEKIKQYQKISIKSLFTQLD